jgi:hypothetical protein
VIATHEDRLSHEHCLLLLGDERAQREGKMVQSGGTGIVIDTREGGQVSTPVRWASQMLQKNSPLHPQTPGHSDPHEVGRARQRPGWSSLPQ